MTRSIDQAAAHKLQLACRRFETAFTSLDNEGEQAQRDVLACMGELLEEFGLLEVSSEVRNLKPKVASTRAGWTIHELGLACRRFDSALNRETDELTKEQARASIVAAMVVVLARLGYEQLARSVEDTLCEFDGRHIEEGAA